MIDCCRDKPCMFLFLSEKRNVLFYLGKCGSHCLVPKIFQDGLYILCFLLVLGDYRNRIAFYSRYRSFHLTDEANWAKWFYYRKMFLKCALLICCDLRPAK